MCCGKYCSIPLLSPLRLAGKVACVLSPTVGGTDCEYHPARHMFSVWSQAQNLEQTNKMGCDDAGDGVLIKDLCDSTLCKNARLVKC